MRHLYRWPRSRRFLVRIPSFLWLVDPHLVQQTHGASRRVVSPDRIVSASRSRMISMATECLQGAPPRLAPSGQSQAMPPSAMATMCQDPGEYLLATSHRLLLILRTIPSASAIRIAAALSSAKRRHSCSASFRPWMITTTLDI